MLIPRALACMACLLIAAAQSATVTVSFTQPERYSDAGTTAPERETNLAVLAAHLKGLGQRLLPDDQALTVEVLDVDLAGSVWPSRRAGPLRIARGGADWPRIQMRYSLDIPGQEPLSGTEEVGDMDYLRHIAGYTSSGSLGHERRMLDEWFRARFVDRSATQR